MKNKTTTISLVIMICLLTLTIFANEGKKYNYKPEQGYVPNAETAIAIAVAIWNPIYGKEKIKKEKPYNAKLKDNVWYVNGTLPCPKGKHCVGGVAEIEISKKTGTILRLRHGK